MKVLANDSILIACLLSLHFAFIRYAPKFVQHEGSYHTCINIILVIISGDHSFVIVVIRPPSIIIVFVQLVGGAGR